MVEGDSGLTVSGSEVKVDDDEAEEEEEAEMA